MKRKALAVCLILLACPSLWADTPLEVEINDFTGGMDSQNLAEKIRANQVRDNQNFRSDFNLGLSRRIGFKNETVGCSSFTAADGLWSFTDPSNNEWLVRLDSAGSLGGANHVGSCLTTAVSTGPLSTASPTDADVGLGKIWFTNKVDGLMSWDGSTFVFYPTSPKASRVAIYKNRVMLSDISNEQSSLRLSGELNGADWSNDSRFSTSPLSIRVGGVNDGLKIYDFFPGLGEGIVFKSNSMYRLLGNDQRDFRVEQITPEIGTIYPNTIAQKGKATLFLSNRGLDAYSPPYNFQLVGQSIQDLLDPLARLTSLSRSLIVDSAADWTSGASSPTAHITTYTIVGSIATNNNTFTDTVGADWDLGTSSSTASTLSTTLVAGALIFTSTAVPVIQNASFETAGAQSTSAALWLENTTFVDSFAGISGAYVGQRLDLNSVESLPPRDGTYTWTGRSSLVLTSGGGPSTKAVVQALDDNGNVLASSAAIISNTAVWNRIELNTSQFLGRRGRVAVSATMRDDGPNNVNSSTLTTNYDMFLGSSVVVFARADAKSCGICGPNFGDTVLSLDLTYAGKGWTQAQMQANFTSQTFDTRVSSPNYDPFRAGVVKLNSSAASSGTVTWGVQTSSASNGCCWGSAINVSTTLPTISNTKNRYIRYVSTFATNLTSTESVVIQVDSVTLGSFVSGYYRLSAQDVGADITSWGLFTAAQDLDGDGSISYELQSSTWTNFNESSWVVTSLNTIPTIPVNRYVFARITLVSPASTATPFVDNITFNWEEGAGNPVPIAATWRDSYYLLYSTNITNITNNDRIAILNRNNMLDQFVGSTISAVAVHNNTLFMGDAYPSGDIYAMDKSTSGTDPNGSVRSSVTLRRLDGGGHPDADKIWDQIYFTLSRADASVSQIFAVDYAVNGSTTFYSASNIELSTGALMGSLRSDIPIDQLRQGQFLDVRLRELTQNTLPYTLNRVRVYGTILEVP